MTLRTQQCAQVKRNCQRLKTHSQTCPQCPFSVTCIKQYTLLPILYMTFWAAHKHVQQRSSLILS
ncbi:hypothetical protein SRHO_G00077810, partial [Serrasalmus rhombeus]